MKRLISSVNPASRNAAVRVCRSKMIARPPPTCRRMVSSSKGKVNGTPWSSI
jgi:hypothetical protein